MKNENGQNIRMYCVLSRLKFIDLFDIGKLNMKVGK